MPFESKAQERFMYAKHPDIANKWQKEFGQPSNLPSHAHIAKTNPQSVGTGLNLSASSAMPTGMPSGHPAGMTQTSHNSSPMPMPSINGMHQKSPWLSMKQKTERDV